MWVTFEFSAKTGIGCFFYIENKSNLKEGECFITSVNKGKKQTLLNLFDTVVRDQT